MKLSVFTTNQAHNGEQGVLRAWIAIAGNGEWDEAWSEDQQVMLKINSMKKNSALAKMMENKVRYDFNMFGVHGRHCCEQFGEQSQQKVVGIRKKILISKQPMKTNNLSGNMN